MIVSMIPAKQGVDVNLCVSDVDQSLTFFLEVLGLEFVEKYQSPAGTCHRLRFGDSFVKLTDPNNPPGEPGPTGIDGAVGYRAVTFQIDDFDEVWAAATGSGAPVHMEYTAYPKAGLKVGMVLDPDGNVVELLQRGTPWEE